MPLARLLAARPLGYFIDAHAPMLGRDGQPVAGLFAEDGLHLSPEGYRLWAEILRSHRHPLLAR